AKQRDFLALYSRRLNTVEGNTTFYATPNVETIERWRAETPTGFRFCFKFPQAITHRKRLREVGAETEEFLDRLERLGDRAGPSFLQLPPTFGASNLPSLISYLDSLPRDFRYAVEVRHPSFFRAPAEAALEEALRERGVTRVLFDVRGLRSAGPDEAATRAAQRRKPDVPVRYSRTAPFAFVRFIAHPEVEANAALLDEWAGRVAAWLAAGDDVFFFTHSPNDALSPVLARDLHARIARIAALHPVPPLPPWEEAAQEPKQANLF
ncbi:MAG: DUF72 domain-containing protein, partial [Anaerolineales bacterium]